MGVKWSEVKWSKANAKRAAVMTWQTKDCGYCAPSRMTWVTPRCIFDARLQIRYKSYMMEAAEDRQPDLAAFVEVTWLCVVARSDWPHCGCNALQPASRLHEGRHPRGLHSQARFINRLERPKYRRRRVRRGIKRIETEVSEGPRGEIKYWPSVTNGEQIENDGGKIIKL